MAVRIAFFVHGTTTDNEKDLAIGWQDGELLERGIRQAEDWRNTQAWKPGWEYVAE